MKKIMLILISLMLTTNVYAHEESKIKLIFGKKCTVNENTIVSSYVWVVEKKSDWQKEINKKNCKQYQ